MSPVHVPIVVEAHVVPETHHYLMHYPAHPARPTDPHYVDFNEYHRRTRNTARCFVGQRIGFAYCRDEHGAPCVIDPAGEMSGLELHHSHVEFSLQNGIDLKALEVDYPGVSTRTTVGAWVESGTNLRWLCAEHHRGAAGCHTAAHADWEASQYIPGLLS